MADALAHWRLYADAKRRGDEEEAQRILDQHDADDRAYFVKFLRDGGYGSAADSYLASMKEVDSGRMGARQTWHSISAAQRRALADCMENGGRVDRDGKEYRHVRRHQPYRPVYVATIRNLCSRGLLEWEGGAFDPEGAAVLTEKGRFVLAFGPTPDPTA